jgi:hypothetical protein
MYLVLKREPQGRRPWPSMLLLLHPLLISSVGSLLPPPVLPPLLPPFSLCPAAGRRGGWKSNGRRGVQASLSSSRPSQGTHSTRRRQGPGTLTPDACGLKHHSLRYPSVFAHPFGDIWAMENDGFYHLGES